MKKFLPESETFAEEKKNKGQDLPLETADVKTSETGEIKNSSKSLSSKK